MDGGAGETRWGVEVCGAEGCEGEGEPRYGGPILGWASLAVCRPGVHHGVYPECRAIHQAPCITTSGRGECGGLEG